MDPVPICLAWVCWVVGSAEWWGLLGGGLLGGGVCWVVRVWAFGANYFALSADLSSQQR